MANVEMKTLTIGENTYEIVDETARSGVTGLQEKFRYLNEDDMTNYDSLLALFNDMYVDSTVIISAWTSKSDFPEQKNAYWNIKITKSKSIGYSDFYATYHNGTGTVVESWIGSYNPDNTNITWSKTQGTSTIAKLPEDTDFNDITSAGMYTVYTGTNSPSGTKTHFNVIVLPYNNDSKYLAQMAFYMGDVNLYRRQCNNGVWSDWMHYAKQSDVDELNTKIIHYKDVEIKLNTVTWTKSTQGLYYSSEITVSDVKAILGLAILNFGYLTAEQHIVPVLATTESSIRFTASTSSFSDSAFLKLRLLYID